MRDYLTDDRVVLRRYRLGDERELYEAVTESIRELTKRGFYSTHESGFTPQNAREDVQSRIRSWNYRHSHAFVIEESPSLVFTGNCVVNEFEPERKHAGMGCWVRSSRAGRGIATAAVRILAKAAFEDLELCSLGIYTNRENLAARRVAEKAGAVLDGVVLQDDGGYCAVYTLFPESIYVS